jgi:hypothetical protein
MTSRNLLVIAAALLVSGVASAQNQASLEYTPVSCIRAGELPLLQVNVEGEGHLRAYFRRINTTDWCSVEGTNEGPLSRVVLPKFENGDQIEYFFVLVEGRRVVARSPRIYRTSVTLDCQLPWARHNLKLSLSCGTDESGIPTSLGAGYAVNTKIVSEVPPSSTPDRPNN